MEKLELIRKKCIETNPSILDLEFGCEVMLRNSSIVNVICSISKNEEGEEYVFTTYGATADKVYLRKKFEHDNYIKKVIGRQITLADVLMAIERKYHTDSFWSYFENLILKWNLKEPLGNQSEETIDFLYSLLK